MRPLRSLWVTCLIASTRPQLEEMGKRQQHRRLAPAHVWGSVGPPPAPLEHEGAVPASHPSERKAGHAPRPLGIVWIDPRRQRKRLDPLSHALRIDRIQRARVVLGGAVWAEQLV